MGHHGDPVTAVDLLERAKGRDHPGPEFPARLPTPGAHIQVASAKAGEILGPAPRDLVMSEAAPVPDVELPQCRLQPGGDPEAERSDLGGLARPPKRYIT